MIRGLLTGKEPHEVDIPATGLFYFSGRINGLRISID